MAQSISMREWVESLSYMGEFVSFEVRLVKIRDDKSIDVIPVINAGAVTLWEGAPDNIVVGGSLSLSGFKLEGGNLVLEDFEGML
jgi:hypothetical protein